ncbi:MAG TPA: glycerol-3-phosphate 1-O-acyltransferase PlsY [Thermoanaerobaculia bacterium]|nr:glycerol-3-phosphate 1-O-acyltransferase PlsY [Thermoanaerobaculia bacterium]
MRGTTGLALVAAAYLLGSVSFSFLIVKIKEGKDVRRVGSGNAGATNVMRASGLGAAVLALLLDLGKGMAAVLGTRLLDAPPPVVGGAAFAVVLGHVFPLFLGFRGGKGVATAAGALGALEPMAMLATLAVFISVVVWKRYVSLGSVVAALVFPLLAWAGDRLGWVVSDPSVVVASAAIAMLVLFRHRSNLARLRRGAEPRLGERAA